MRVLIDTHALLWWFVDDPRLSAKARTLILDERTDVLVSAASAWEIATKHRLGKLPEAEEVATRFDQLVDADGFTPLPIRSRHALVAGAFDAQHRDPFDRMLAAQAQIERVPLLTADRALSVFPIKTLW